MGIFYHSPSFKILKVFYDVSLSHVDLSREKLLYSLVHEEVSKESSDKLSMAIEIIVRNLEHVHSLFSNPLVHDDSYKAKDPEFNKKVDIDRGFPPAPLPLPMNSHGSQTDLEWMFGKPFRSRITIHESRS